VLAALAALTTTSGCSRGDPDDLAYRARADFAAGRLAESEADLARLARIRRLTLAERLLRSQVASERGRLDEALGALDDPRALMKGPEAALIASRRGELELDRRRFRAAESELKRALNLDPGLIDARRRLIWLYAQQGRSAEIASHGRELIRVAPPDFFDLFVWTLARRESLDLAESAEVLGRVIQVDPGDRVSRLALSECLRRLGRLGEADSTLRVLPAADPEARAARARIALDRGDSAGAQNLLGADSAANDHPALARLRGRLALGSGDASAAIGHFHAALNADPNDRDTQFGLAQALRLTGQPEAARPHAELARALDRLEWLVQSARPLNRRNNPATLQTIAEACRALGRHDLASAWYRLALSHDPGNIDLQNALSQIDSIPSGRP
jgi:tetratricopeptide (TPR) repeat protein